MKRFALMVVVLAAACSPSALSQIAGTSTAAVTPSPSPSAFGSMSPAPKPTPTVQALGEAYLVVADKYNHSRDRLVMTVTYGQLAEIRVVCSLLAGTTDEYVAGLTKIPFTTAKMKKDAAALAKEAKLEAKAFRRCAAAKTMTTLRKNLLEVDRLTPSGTVAAKKLRGDLGLSTSALP